MSLLTVDRLVVVVINGGIDVAFITQEIYCTPASVCVCVEGKTVRNYCTNNPCIANIHRE